MELIARILIIPILQSCISDNLQIEGKGLFLKLKYMLFIRSLKKKIKRFCNENECLYLKSDAFEKFIKTTDFFNKIIERSISIKINESDEEFYKIWINKAREIADAENFSFSFDDENVVKKMMDIIEDDLKTFYSERLSNAQKYVLADNHKNFANINEQLREIKNQNEISKESLLEAINNKGELEESDILIISNILIEYIWVGRIKDFETVGLVISKKSSDLRYLYECFKDIFIIENTTKIVDCISEIKNTTIRDNAIRNILPLVFFINKNINGISNFVTSESLKFIVETIETNEFGSIFEQLKTCCFGVIEENLILNKELFSEEKWLIKHIVVIYAYLNNIIDKGFIKSNFSDVEMTWLIRLLISDAYIDYIIANEFPENGIKEITLIVDECKKSNIYMNLGRSIRAVYIGVQVKKMLVSENYSDIESFIPYELREIKPLPEFIYLAKIKKGEVDFEDLINYCENNKTYWLLINYFIEQDNTHELIEFCISNDELLSEDVRLCIMFIKALKDIGNSADYAKYLRKYLYQYRKYYEYWDEIILGNESDVIKIEFLEACKDGDMICINSTSIFLLIEQLLKYEMYTEAKIYVKKAEAIYESNAVLKKYMGFIDNNLGRELDALNHFYEAFNLNPKDLYVIELILCLSFSNNRKIRREVIVAAEQTDSERLYSLIAEYYIQEGDRASAEFCLIKSILLTKNNSYNHAFEQYITFHSNSSNEDTRRIKYLDSNTVAICKSDDESIRHLCIYESDVLPSSPWHWNGDYHINMDIAATLGCLRKRKGDRIEFENINYTIDDIVALDFYIFRKCLSKMKDAGFVKVYNILDSNGNIDKEVLNDIKKEYLGDDREKYKVLEEYNNLENFPLPLYAYKKISRLTYLEFTDRIISGKDLFIREFYCNSILKDKYIISFTALIMLYKIGFPSEKLIESGGYITTSTSEQVNGDATKIMKEYNQDIVASMGMIDGDVYLNETDDNSKLFWIKEAGDIKQYCKDIPKIESSGNLKENFFEVFDNKDIFGICDYDAICCANNSDDYSLISIEAFMSLLSHNNMVKFNVISLVDMFICLKVEVTEFIMYLSKLMDYGCLKSISRNAIVYISDCVRLLDSAKCTEIYKLFNELIMKIDVYSDNWKHVVLQAMDETINQLKEGIEIEPGILKIILR